MYWVSATVWQACVAPSTRNNPVTQPDGGSVTAVPSCYLSPGYQYNANLSAEFPLGYCEISVVEIDRTLKPCTMCAGNPIFVGTGNKQQKELDYPGMAGSLEFFRVYNSGAQFGSTWRHTYARRVEVVNYSGTKRAVVHHPDASYVFLWTGSAWQGDSDVNLQLFGDNGYFWLVSADGTETEQFGSDNQLLYILRSGGSLKATLTYDYGFTPARLVSVADDFGHSLALAYDGQGRLSTVTVPGGGVYTYGYDSDDNITSVTYPGGAVRTYVYNEVAYTSGANLPHHLTGIIDENSARFANYGYDSAGRAILTEHAGGADRVEVSYTSAPQLLSSVAIDVPNNIKVITRYIGVPTGATVNTGGSSRQYSFASVNGGAAVTGASGLCNGRCTPVPASQTLDANGNVTSKTDFNGNVTNSTFDMSRNLETSRTEAYGTVNARTVATSWHSTFRLPETITESDRTTELTYDANGNVLTKTLTDTSVSPTVSRTWTYTYNSYGQVLTEDGPRTDVSDVTTYTYYSCSTGDECGQLETVTNALSQVTTYNTYNAHGQPLTITDPNGVVTTLTYDARQRLTSRQVGSETTTFQYWPTGLLKKVILPDSSTLLYTYDNAHRLYKIEDGAGNRLQYTLDAMGNRTAENSYDPSSTLKRTHARVFNALNQLWKDIGAAGTSAVTTEFAYDDNGNRTDLNAPLGRDTAQAFDELNRLTQITDPESGITQFTYDDNDNLTSVTDPRSLVTSYTYTGFGDLLTQVSPDTGTTTNTYDSGGNLETSTDARSAVTTYTYDELNRVTSAVFSSGGVADQTITYGYDSGTYGKGHLTSASDANHSLAWTYDAQGRVTGKGQTIGGITKSIGYGYTNGNLVTMALPSGQTVTYGYNSNHQVTSVTVGSTPVLTSATYDPFGPATGWTWGNSTTTTRVYDADGNLTQFASGGLKTYAYDDALRVTGITDTVNSANSYSYGYDDLDRLTSASKTGTSYGWTYDANGNRLSQTSTAASTYTVSNTSNQIDAISGALSRTYAYDAAGNTLTYSNVTATYNNRGRMKTLQKASTTATYVYNALGQFIKQSGGPSGTVLYLYDEAGHLIGEYDGSGTLIQETVWLGDIPVATLRPSGMSVAIYYVHADHLNTPIRVTRPSDNKLMWTWYASPFGTETPNENPASGGTFKYNLRFAGQLYDSHAGLHQNYFRDYDPAIGRYAESDPIGIDGGLNTYLYAGANPVQFSDPDGLQAVLPWVGPRVAPLVRPWVRPFPIDPVLPMPLPVPSEQDRAECEKACDAQWDKDIFWCEVMWKMKGRPSGGYSACKRAANRKYVKCYQDCGNNSC